ncbi:MAG: hypothetical protein EHM35_19265 [Planctomycetaceae bacterium]|nr:MAG: hypothetical protein EHM35_19265 [Planctomycetaceae bacterium]
MKLRLPWNILSAKERQIVLQQKETALRPHCVVKPNRIFGACWTSDKVARRKPVVMCPECWRRYRGWWKRAHYRGDWGWQYRVDCDGCSTVGILGTLFRPEEKFYETLSPAHGRNPQP